MRQIDTWVLFCAARLISNLTGLIYLDEIFISDRLLTSGDVGIFHQGLILGVMIGESGLDVTTSLKLHWAVYISGSFLGV